MKGEIMLPLVQIAVDQHGTKNVQKVYNNKYVYLDNGTEFQLSLHNPTQKVISASISINGKCQDSVIVLKPGQRIWLDRFLDSKRKMKFDTYTIEDSDASKAAIANNGIIKVEFFNEREKPTEPILYSDTIMAKGCLPDLSRARSAYYKHSVSSFCSSGEHNMLYSAGISTGAGPSDIMFNATSDAFSLMDASVPSEIVTGRVEAGSKSDQEFVDVDYDFDWNPFCRAELQILPMSTKPIEVSDLKIYCKTPGCGRKQKKGEKFCSSCGNKY